MPSPGARAVLNVGVTGHRAARLPPGALATAPAAIEAVLRLLAIAAAPTPPTLHTPLATGADQFAATAARSAGYRVHALLPFAATTYAADFTDGAEREAFSAQLAAADRVTALAGCDGEPAAAYIAVGRAIIEASDIMIAVWDGAQRIVPGGTAHVVALALEAERPVIHIPVGGTASEPPLLLRRDRAAIDPAAPPLRSVLANAADFARLLASV